jgi:chromosome partitioning protein
MSKIYAFANQKGGVGKTTTAVNIAAYLAWQGRHVLLIDLDPQGNATASVGVDRFAIEQSLYDVFMGKAALHEILTPTSIEHLFVAPSTQVLASAEVELAATADREYILSNAIALDRTLFHSENSNTNNIRLLREQFDHILIDCPPSLGVLTVNALTAADYVVVPVQCEYLALEGLAQLMQTITLVRENLNPNLQLFGLVMTMFDPRARLAGQVIQEVRNHFPNELFDTLIPRNVRVAEAPSFGEPLVKYDIHSRGAQAYESLTNEFLMREAKIVHGVSSIGNRALPIPNFQAPDSDSLATSTESTSSIRDPEALWQLPTNTDSDGDWEP